MLVSLPPRAMWEGKTVLITVYNPCDKESGVLINLQLRAKREDQGMSVILTPPAEREASGILVNLPFQNSNLRTNQEGDS